MSGATAARIFTALASATGAFQLALAAGAPWGALTQGGTHTGVLPPTARALAVFSAVLLVLFIRLVRQRAGLSGLRNDSGPRWLIWIVVVYCAVGTIANAVTPSGAERALWLPVVIIMLGTSLRVALHDRQQP